MRFAETIDRAIFAVAPQWGARRIAARRNFAVAARFRDRAERILEERFAHWEGADDDDRTRANRFMRSGLSTDAALDEELETLRERSGELYRSDPFAHSFIEGRVSNIVGRGIRSQPRIRANKRSLTPITKKAARKMNRALKEDYRRWERHAGVYGESLAVLQRMVQRNWDIDGEVLIHFTNQSQPSKSIPLAIEVISADRLESPHGAGSDPNISMGVERDPVTKQVVAYHIRTHQPGDPLDRNKIERVPAFFPNGLPRMVHCFEKMLPGQSRGWPRMVAAIGKLKDRHDYDETTMISEQVAACHTAFVKTGETDPEQMAAGGASETLSTGERIENLEPGTVTYLRDGQEITFGNPNRPSGTFGPFMEHHERAICAALNYPYELLTKNWTGLSYSAGRLSLIDGRIAFGCQQALLVEQFLGPLWNHLVTQSVLFGSLGEYVAALDYRRLAGRGSIRRRKSNRPRTRSKATWTRLTANWPPAASTWKRRSTSARKKSRCSKSGACLQACRR
jgi:lambda family phage portal protein